MMVRCCTQMAVTSRPMSRRNFQGRGLAFNAQASRAHSGSPLEQTDGRINAGRVWRNFRAYTKTAASRCQAGLRRRIRLYRSRRPSAQHVRRHAHRSAARQAEANQQISLERSASHRARPKTPGIPHTRLQIQHAPGELVEVSRAVSTTTRREAWQAVLSHPVPTAYTPMRLLRIPLPFDQDSCSSHGVV